MASVAPAPSTQRSERNRLAIALEYSAERQNRSLARALAAARTAENNRGRDIVVLDLGELTTMCDYFVLATGTSRRQLHAISEEIDDVLQRDFTTSGWGSKATPRAAGFCSTSATWWSICSTPKPATIYALEQLWAGCRRVPLESSGCSRMRRPAKSRQPGSVSMPRAASDCPVPSAALGWRCCSRLGGLRRAGFWVCTGAPSGGKLTLMNILSQLQDRFRTALAASVADPAELDRLVDMVRPAQDRGLRRLSGQLRDAAGQAARPAATRVAAELVGRLDVADLCEPPEIAGPGFINLRLKTDWLAEQLAGRLTDERLGIAPVARAADVS